MENEPIKQFSTFKEDLENIGIHITDEQYSDLCEINLFMKGMPDIPVYNILLILKTLGLIPTKMIEQEANQDSNADIDNGFQNEFNRKFGKLEERRTMLKRIIKHLFSPQIIRIPDKTRVVCFSKGGNKYLKVFNTENGASICFRVKSIDYENSDLKNEYHPETMFADIESNQSVTILNQ